MKKIISIILLINIIVSLTGCGGKVETRNIKSCVLDKQTTNSSSGTFILGMGVFSSDTDITTKYYMYIKSDEGYRLQEIDSEYLQIVETDKRTPSIKGYFSSDDGVSGGIIYGGQYTVYVPTGTITQEYKTKINTEK